MRKLKIGVLGSGDIATRVSNTLRHVEEIELYAVASRTYAHARDFGEKFGYCKIYETYDEVLDDPDVDLAYVGLHHTQHYEYAKKCLDKRKPTLLEKPFTINHYQTQALLREFKENGVFLCEALWTRFIPMRRRIEEIVSKGMIGEPRMIDVNMMFRICDNPRMTELEKGGGALLDLGVYALNFASMFFGNEVEEMTSLSTFWKTGADEQEAVLMKYPNHRIAVCKISMLGGGSAKGIIYGTAGRIEVDNVMNLDHALVYNAEGEVMEELSKEKENAGYESGYMYEFLACRQAIQNNMLECGEMPHEETRFLMEQYDRLRAAWGFDYPCEMGL